MVTRKKPKKPVVPGNPPGVLGKYEVKKTLSAVGYSALGMLVMGVKLIATFANTSNVGDMLTNGTSFGGVGLIIIGVAVILKNKFMNNTDKKM